MKKIACIFGLIVVLAVAVCIFVSAGRYRGWKEIEIQNVGNIKIPEGWTCQMRNNEIYFTDEGVTEFTQDSVHLAGYVYNEKDSSGAYRMFDKDAIIEERIMGEIFSNSTYRGINRYKINGESCEKMHIKFYDVGKDKEVFMIAWDDSVTYDDMKKLAKSFDRYEE